MVAGGRVPKNMLEGLGLGLLDCEGMGLVVDRVESVGKSQNDWVRVLGLQSRVRAIGLGFRVRATGLGSGSGS